MALEGPGAPDAEARAEGSGSRHISPILANVTRVSGLRLRLD